MPTLTRPRINIQGIQKPIISGISNYRPIDENPEMMEKLFPGRPKQRSLSERRKNMILDVAGAQIQGLTNPDYDIVGGVREAEMRDKAGAQQEQKELESAYQQYLQDFQSRKATQAKQKFDIFKQEEEQAFQAEQSEYERTFQAKQSEAERSFKAKESKEERDAREKIEGIKVSSRGEIARLKYNEMTERFKQTKNKNAQSVFDKQVNSLRKMFFASGGWAGGIVQTNIANDPEKRLNAIMTAADLIYKADNGENYESPMKIADDLQMLLFGEMIGE